MLKWNLFLNKNKANLFNALKQFHPLKSFSTSKRALELEKDENINGSLKHKNFVN